MALIHCPECGKEISDQAPSCIHCGYPMDPKAPEALYSVVLMDSVPNPKDVLMVLREQGGMTSCEAEDALRHLPFPVWQGLTLEEAYRSIQAFERCGVAKVILDEDARTREDMNRADPIPPPPVPKEPEGGIGFGGTVLAVIVGIVVTLILLSLF